MASDTNISSATDNAADNDVKIKIAVHDEKFNTVMEKLDATNNKIDMLVGEMRDRDNQRHAEIQALDAKIDAKIDGMGKHVRNLSYASIGAIAAMVITVLLNLPKG